MKTPPPKSRINYTSEEKAILKQLISKHKILLSKKTDCGSRHAKKKAWETIAAEFSSTKGCSKRTPAQLIKLWDNMKFTSRKMSKISNEEHRANDLKEIFESSADTDPVLNMISNNTGTEKKYLHNTNTVYLLGKLNTDGNHFMSELFDDGNSNDVTESYNQRSTSIATGTATDVENNDIIESYDASSSSFSIKDKDVLVENLIREEIESTRIANENQTYVESKRNDGRKLKNFRITYSEWLLFKKQQMERMSELRKAMYIAKRDALKAKERAFKMKSAYYEFKMKKSNNFTVLV